MKILVTGGAGFIGLNVVDGYVNTGYEFTIFDNLTTQIPKKKTSQ
jgi:UDP-glucose 4-epimerase